MAAQAAQAAQAEASESWYLALLGFAEHFRTSSPPKIRLCVHCLQAVFPFKPPQRIEARTHLQLGSVLYHHTKNSELARSHLEKAVRKGPGIAARRAKRGCSRAAAAAAAAAPTQRASQLGQA
ncbi:MAU2 chromatid cohesion factor homolog [Vombatus ursinus]|uniref:MAU2 chromatid cohesion factor homolog n=1 Tax=Vombatus ursinus TaxID=29139 RepID=UPI000FFD9B36|nr:MAU2 chromatid cohesion factor homolog [Vombatus ursinus]